jgi:hypothetical protein
LLAMHNRQHLDSPHHQLKPLCYELGLLSSYEQIYRVSTREQG